MACDVFLFWKQPFSLFAFYLLSTNCVYWLLVRLYEVTPGFWLDEYTESIQKIRHIYYYLMLCIKIIQTLKIIYGVEIFAIINMIFQIPSIPYFADFAYLRSQMKDLKQNCLFAACCSKQNHCSTLVRDLFFFLYTILIKTTKAGLKVHLITIIQTQNIYITWQFSLIPNNLNLIGLFANCCRLNKILQTLKHCSRICIP